MLGAPGAGKTTQAELLAATCGLAHISVGRLLRQRARPEIQAQMAEGGLVDPSIANQLVDQAIRDHLASPGSIGLVIDGFPRSTARADWLLANWRSEIELAWVLDLDPKTAGHRLDVRGRSDDQSASVDHRWQIYRRDTPQALDRLRAAAVPVVIINANRPADLIHREIRQTLPSRQS